MLPGWLEHTTNYLSLRAKVQNYRLLANVASTDAGFYRILETNAVNYAVCLDVLWIRWHTVLQWLL